jgi:integrase
MDQNKTPISRDMSLELLVSAALKEIERLGYSRRSRNRYQAVWEHFAAYCKLNKHGSQFAGELAVRFLDEYRVADGEMVPGEGWRRHIVWSVKTLVDFAENGQINRGITEVGAIHLAPPIQNTLRDYAQYCKERLQLRTSSLDLRTKELTIFLGFLHSQKARTTLGEIQALDLSDFVSWRRHLQPATVSRIVSDVRSFLRFLVMRGILKKDLTVELPTIRVPRDAKIPSVWNQELIIRLLDAVDRSSPKGKRDYAILLLACRLALRAGDIRTLTLDQIHWEESTIELTQAKTQVPLRLPLSSEVGEALIDYLKFRPSVPHREVFLKMRHPFEPFMQDNLYHVVTYWRQLAGIRFQSPQKHGIHSLRHTLATRLLQKGTPFSTIAEILGHTSLESTRIYAKADVEALRDVALDPEEVTHVE